jgi:cytochrome c553
MKSVIALLILVAVALPIRADEVNFNRDVRPILAEHCFACHGFDAKARKARLRLDVPEGALVKRRGVYAIVPGKPEESEVWSRIVSQEPGEVMPPPETNKPLSAAQKEILKKWIEQGAKYQKHWSFEPITRPAVPESADHQWPIINPIDAFILARLAREKLSPSPEADRETLIRRVAFALTGLPPTVAEVDAFLADQSPGAYERMVDRYLASPRYGEEMARHWLDVARYADTHGLHLDNERSMWLYRDWVIKAFNENLPFDQFTVWQLAGDQLPNPTPDQLVATGFIRAGVTTSEGGSIDQEWYFRNAVERTTAAAQAWLGLTAGCAVCHDHKFDPISMKEYYSLYAFFYSAADPAMDGNINTTPPFYKRPTPEQKAALDAATQREAAALAKLRELAAKVDYVDPATAEDASGPQPVRDVIFDDTFPLGTTDRNTSRNAADWLTDPPFGAPSGRRVLRQANSNFTEDVITPQLIPVMMPNNGRLEAWVRPDPVDVPQAVAIQIAGPSGSKRFWWGGDNPGENEYGRSVSGTRVGPLPQPGKWTRLSLPAEKLGLKPGQRITSVTLQQFGGITYWDAVAVTGEADPAADPRASFRTWWSGLGKRWPNQLPGDLKMILDHGPQPETEVAKLRAYYLAHIARPIGELAVVHAEWEKARADQQAADDAIPGTFIFKDLDRPREAFVMLRGEYDKPGEKVEPGVPDVLPPLTATGPRPTRLDLANWLISPDHPLTARVAVNRLWQQFFGTGLVKTSDDFGSQGEPPSHPELLDWLAADLRDSGWDIKRFVKQLVMSATFRQQSSFTPELRQRDPENRLLARGPRFRLDAEQLRDNALFTSGLINLEMGGRGVKPYQPPNIWEPVGYGDSNTRYYLMDHGPALYRRSIYVFIKRTAPPPFMTNFDAPNREQSCTVRPRTNTPLQALQLMNDVQHFEAARALAERAMSEGGNTTAERITFLYRTVLARKPDPDELRIVTAALEKQFAIFQADPAAAKKAIQVGESQPQRLASDTETAAWTMIANLILNMDETVNRN